MDGEYQAITEEYVNAEIDKVVAAAKQAYQDKMAEKLYDNVLNVELAHKGEQTAVNTVDSAGVPIMLSLPEQDNVTLEYFSQYGSFYLYPDQPQEGRPETQLQHQGKRCTAPEGHMVYWRPYQPEQEGANLPSDIGKVEIAVIVRESGHVVGGIMLNMYTNSGQASYSPNIYYHPIYFPKVDGVYQPVTEEYLQGWFDAYEYDWVDLTATKQ